jgi:predicted RNA binding protein YcfA (HicA-like mRNA interferase family)
MQHPDKKSKIAVPFHSGKEVKKGLLSGLLKQAKIKTSKR